MVFNKVDRLIFVGDYPTDREAAEAVGNSEDSETPPDREWQKKQEKLEDAIRDQVRQSPQAKAAALENQAEKAKDLAKNAEELKEAQKNLSELASQDHLVLA